MQKLIEKAIDAAKKSYSPYSNIEVGAALLTPRGEIFLGTNVENASYGLTICAERAAICNAIVNGLQNFDAIALYSPQIQPILPCGACCQVLAEFNKKMIIISLNKDSQIIETDLTKIFSNPFEIKN